MFAQAVPDVEGGHIPHRWDDPLQEPPRVKAPAAEVAEFIEGAVVYDHFYGEGGWEMSELQQRRFLQDLCEHEKHSWSWSQVARALRKSRIAEIARATGELGEVKCTASGIPIFLARFPAPQPMCPIKRRPFHVGFFTERTYEKPCGSPSCAMCAPDLVEALLGQVRQRITALEAVYVAQMPWDNGLTNRIGQRRSDHGMNTFTYRDVNDLVTILGDMPLEGKRPRAVPFTSDRMTAKEVGVMLVESVLWIPGLVSADFSAKWAFPAKKLPTNDAVISLDGLDDHEVERFKAIAAALVRDRYGIEAGVEPIPAKYWAELKERLAEIKKMILDSSS